MNPAYRHWLERMQVRLTAATALAVAWFACWQLVRPWDPQAALAFLPDWGYGRLATYAGVIWVIAAGCAVLTLSAPPHGALLATLVGAVGTSLHSGPMRTLLWRWQDDEGPLFALLAVEVLLLALILLGAMILIGLVRGLFRRLRPGWVWSAPDGEQSPAPPANPSRSWASKVWQLLRSRPSELRASALRGMGCLLMELALAVIVLVFTFRSTDRGQIAFALAASYFVAALVADHVFPVRSSLPIWLGPIIMAFVVFMLGSTEGAAAGGMWRDDLMVARGLPLRAALPVDWFSWGGAGALAGFAVSHRLHLAARAKQQAEAKEAKKGKP